MTVLPPGLISPPEPSPVVVRVDAAPIAARRLDRARARSTRPLRAADLEAPSSPVWAVAFVALLLLTIVAVVLEAAVVLG